MILFIISIGILFVCFFISNMFAYKAIIKEHLTETQYMIWYWTKFYVITWMLVALLSLIYNSLTI